MKIIVNFLVFGQASNLYCKQKIKISVNPTAVTRNPCPTVASVKSVFHPISTQYTSGKILKMTEPLPISRLTDNDKRKPSRHAGRLQFCLLLGVVHHFLSIFQVSL